MEETDQIKGFTSDGQDSGNKNEFNDPKLLKYALAISHPDEVYDLSIVNSITKYNLPAYSNEQNRSTFPQNSIQSSSSKPHAGPKFWKLNILDKYQQISTSKSKRAFYNKLYNLNTYGRSVSPNIHQNLSIISSGSKCQMHQNILHEYLQLSTSKSKRTMYKKIYNINTYGNSVSRNTYQNFPIISNALSNKMSTEYKKHESTLPIINHYLECDIVSDCPSPSFMNGEFLDLTKNSYLKRTDPIGNHIVSLEKYTKHLPTLYPFPSKNIMLPQCSTLMDTVEIPIMIEKENLQLPKANILDSPHKNFETITLNSVLNRIDINTLKVSIPSDFEDNVRDLHSDFVDGQKSTVESQKKFQMKNGNFLLENELGFKNFTSSGKIIVENQSASATEMAVSTTRSFPDLQMAESERANVMRYGEIRKTDTQGYKRRHKSTSVTEIQDPTIDSTTDHDNEVSLVECPRRRQLLAALRAKVTRNLHNKPPKRGKLF